MLSPRQAETPALPPDPIHERIMSGIAGLHVEGWKYVGYRTRTSKGEQWLALRFEKGIVDKLAGADVRLTSKALFAPGMPIAEFLASRLTAVEDALRARRAAELAGLN